MLDTPEESYNRSQNRPPQTEPQPPSSGEPLSSDDSPELLRWRADILLDEMMLGAVDIAAGRPDAGPAEPASSSSASASVIPSSSEQAEPDPQGMDAGLFEGGPMSSPPSRSPFAGNDAPSLNASTGTSAISSGSSPYRSSRESSSFVARQSVVQQADALESSDHEIRPDPSDPWLTDPASGDWSGRSASQPSVAQSLHTSNSQTPIRPSETSTQGSGNMLRPPSASTALSGVDAAAIDGGSAGGVERAEQAVGWGSSQASTRDLRSNLLPRESQFDARGHFQEIHRLEAEVEATLPAEHEWSVRSRHLLAKATDVLQNSPERSAEVDYYLQQVRSILDRAQQTYRWSLIYANRLKLYLGGWALLSTVVIVAVLLYAAPLTELLLEWFPTMTRLWAQNFIALILAIFAGTLGGSLGALRNIFVFRSAGRGFVDRKYSLRGLFLPLMAGLFGLLIYLLFGVVFYFAGVKPLQNLLIVGVPALLALLFGLTQESLYGTAG